MAWKSKYPDYPDFIGTGALGDVRARLSRQPTKWVDREPTEEELAQYHEDNQLYWASMLMDFVNRVDAGEEIPQSMLEEFRRAFVHVLQGAVWEDSIYLPGREFKEEWYSESPKARRDKDLCTCVAARIRYSGEKVTEAIASIAAERHLSFETVRAAYYKWKTWRDRQNEELSKLMKEGLEDENA